MHLAQTMIKNTEWESVLFPEPIPLDDQRTLKRFRENCDRVEKSLEEKKTLELKRLKERSNAYIDQRLREKARDSDPTDAA